MSAAPLSASADISPAAWKPRHNPWIVAMTVTMATFMEVLDTSVANVSLPHIAGSLSASFDESTWILSSYLISNAVVLPISGWMADVIGRKRFYMSCVALFTASSFLCGLAPSLAWLIVFRVIQGAGGGGLQPSEQSILADTFAPEKLGMAFAIYGMAVVLAPVIGPTLGGYITDHLSWRWIFLVNVPVGIVSLLLTYRIVEDPPHLKTRAAAARKSGRIDYIGLGLVALGLGCLQVVLDKGQREDWFESHFIVAFALVAAVAIAIFVGWEWFQAEPVVDLKLFKSRTFALSALMMFMLGITLYGSTVLMPEFLQQLMGYTAQQAGMVLTPGGLAVIALMPLVGILISTFDGRYLIACGFGISCFAFLHMSNINLQIDFRTAMMYRIYQSAGLAFLFVPISTMAYVGVAPEKNNQISGIINLARNIGASVGISIVTTMLARRSQFHQERLTSHMSAFDLGLREAMRQMTATLSRAGLNPTDARQQTYARMYGMVQRQAAAQSYVEVIWFLAIICLAMVPMVFLMKKNDPKAARRGAH